MTVPVRIAVVGMGGVFPASPRPADLWAHVLGAADTCRDVPSGRWLLDPDEACSPGGPRPDRVYSRRGCFIENFTYDPTGIDLPADLLAGLDPVIHLTLHAGREAWCSARTVNLDRSRVSIILGHIALPTDQASALARSILGQTFSEQVVGPQFAEALCVHPANRGVAALPAAMLARGLGLGGGCFTLDAACASGLYAFKLAMDDLRSGRVDAVLAGGVSRPDCLYTQMGFSQLRALSPTGRCSPFDSRGDGLIVGEGAGIFVLKRLDDAIRDGDSILGVLVAAGLANDVGGSLLAPNSEGQLRAMSAAYQEAGWAPKDIDLIECHATGTPVGDAIEYRSLRTLWGDSGWRVGQCVLGSVKSTVGHLLTAAGAAGLTKVLFALRTATLPPTANFATPGKGLDFDRSPFRVLRQPEDWTKPADRPRRAAISGFGFGGINAHLLVEEWPSADALKPESRPAPIVIQSEKGQPLALVALDARFGPWDSLAKFRERLLATEKVPVPFSAGRWWGVEQSVWFRERGWTPEQFAGFYLEEVAIAADQFRIPPRELEEMLPQQLLVLQVAERLFRDRHLTDKLRLRTGVFLGVALDLNTTNFHLRWSVLKDGHAWARKFGLNEEEEKRFISSLLESVGPPLTANRTMGALGSIAASRVAREFHLGGPSFTVAAEETSGLRALELAARALQRGKIDLAFVGAVDLAGDVRNVLARYQEKAGPFIPPGDGAAGLLVKRLADAERDGDPILAIVNGIGVACGPQADRRALESACQEAALKVNPIRWGSIEATIGHVGAASGLASLVGAVLSLHHRIFPEGRPWLNNRGDGPRRLAVGSLGSDGNCIQVILEEGPTPASMTPRANQEQLFVIEGDDVSGLLTGLENLQKLLAAQPVLPNLAAAWRKENPLQPEAGRAVAIVAREAGELKELLDLVRRSLTEAPDKALPHGMPLLRDRAFYSPEPLGPSAGVAFVFPGSGNDYPRMGMNLALQWPAVLARQESESVRFASQWVTEKTWREQGPPGSPSEKIFGQVCLGCLVTDVLDQFGVRPSAVVGYSLGESAALFALRVWSDRDEMLRRMEASSLFATELTGPRSAARSAWSLPTDAKVDWLSAIIDRGPEEVREALTGKSRVYLQIINTPSECVIGGERPAVEAVAKQLGARLVPLDDASTVHCSVVGSVAEDYRALHQLPTAPPENMRFYSAALGKGYEVTADNAAEAILAQALDTIDFPTVVKAAYRDGAMLFVEVGPGGSCTRMIGAILGDRPHRARAVCVPGVDESFSLLRLLAMLIAERMPVKLDSLDFELPREKDDKGRLVRVPVGGAPFNIKPVIPVGTASRAAPAPVANNPLPLHPVIPVGAGSRAAPAPVASDTLPLQPVTVGAGSRAAPVPVEMAETPILVNAAGESPVAIVHRIANVHQAKAEAHAAYYRLANSMGQAFAQTVSLQTELLEALVRQNSFPARQETPFLDRAQCLEFAVGSIAAVLGSDFAAVDAFPTRVRLPDEPLMLVDRILAVEGVPRSLGSGRVLTEHDVHEGAWYLDCGRIPTCIAVEAGQADLFLSGYLGIDFHTKGRAVYRLLDAVVTFHRGLPEPGATIHYDIHIDNFFRQGDTLLFRFRFEGSVAGQPLLTMKNGCAGFFTAEDLAGGKGIVHTELDRRPQKGTRPDDDLVPMAIEAYTDAQIDSLRGGDLKGCFGPNFSGLGLQAPLGLPEGRMRLVDHVLHLDPDGGRFGVGLIRAEHDIVPDAWFLTCHFVDDQVMPGTLMYECCLHTLRIFLLRRGWVGERGDVVCEPVPGVASGLKCRGQVTATTRKVQYEVTLKEIGYGPEPYAIVDALMFADGKPIVEITNMSLRMVGLDRAQLEARWHGRSANVSPVLFPHERILAFSIGKPSVAFGEPYRVFDQDRVIARLPGPPYLFMDRVTRIDAEPWKMVGGGEIEAEYDVPMDEWYFAADRQEVMPFAVLLEIALQPCGWLAGYVGSALTSPVDLSFRNLGGTAELLETIGRNVGTLKTRVKLTRVASSGGMIIQSYDFAITNRGQEVYRGDTTFGFFSKAALAQQVGIREATLYVPSAEEANRGQAFPIPRDLPFPDDRWRMIDQVDLFVADGGPNALGFIQGSTGVEPAAWFFRAHFYQDPVWPGSLGLESFLQLLKVVAIHHWPDTRQFHTMAGPRHQWLYRGQVIPTNRRVEVQAVVTAIDQDSRRLTAEGYLTVDGRVIYQMKGFTLDAV